VHFTFQQNLKVLLDPEDLFVSLVSCVSLYLPVVMRVMVMFNIDVCHMYTDQSAPCHKKNKKKYLELSLYIVIVLVVNRPFHQDQELHKVLLKSALH